MKAGTYNGSEKARSFLQFGLSGISGKKITSAKLRLYNHYSGSCTGASIYAQRISSAWSSSTLTWSNQPSATSSGQGSLSTARGYNSSCAAGYSEWTVTPIVQAWADGTANYGLRLIAANETSIYTWRRYRSANYVSGEHSHEPHLIVTYNSYPGTAGTPSVTGMTGSGPSSYYTTDVSPELKATVSDPDGGSVRAKFEVYQGSTLKWSGYSAYVASGSTAKVTVPSGSLAQNTLYTIRVWGNDGSLTSKAWSSYISFKIDATAPSTPTITCANVAHEQWYETRPASATTCTFSSSSDTKTFEWTVNGVSKTALTASSGSATTPSVTIPVTGLTKIETRAKDSAGNLSGWKLFRFGTGSPGLTEPLDSDRSTSTFPIDASGPPGATAAFVQWRLAGDTAATWNYATSVKLASSGSAWTGGVSQAGGASITNRLIWNAQADVNTVPALVEVRVCFSFVSMAPCTDPRQVQLLPHAFGSSFPEDAAGPGRVALFTGEVQFSETDVEVPAYVGTLALSRSHRSLAGPVPGPAGVFGPGWAANLEGPEAGLGGFEVIDHTAQDGTIVLLDPEGESYLYYHESETLGAQKVGTYVGLGESGLWEDTLELTSGESVKWSV